MEKYYKPTMDEFRHGFEYEIFERYERTSIGIIEVWGKRTFDINKIDALNQDEYITSVLIRDGYIRVKYLDREDIEACGWKFVGKGKIFSVRDLFEINGYFLEFMDGHSKESPTIIIYCADDGTPDFTDDHSVHIWCHNKSELQFQMRRLSYNFKWA